jgi:toluene monooxygenase electron transfer component
MANLPNPAGEWRFVIRRVPEGLASAVLFGGGLEVRAIELDAPYGLAYLRATPRDVLCVAGGSGLSPMLSIIRAAASDPHFAGRRLHLYYGGRAPADLCAETEISGLPGFGTTLLHRAAVSDPEAATRAGYGGPQGFIHAVVEAAFGDALRDHEIYFAGPPAMADAMQKMLVLTRKVPVGQVHFDRFY